MSQNYEIIEVTKENESEYLPGIVNLEQLVLDKMEREGRTGQLFTTGKEGIHEYIDSDCNNVLIAVRNNNGREEQIISAAYITHGQTDFTYNDITKYFKCDESYQEYIKSKYPKEEFEKIIRKIYIDKICAYKYARDIILKEQGVQEVSTIMEKEKNDIFLRLIEQEYNDPQNQFHEKSEIRDNLNKYMSLYMKIVKKNLTMYQDFYWIDFEYLQKNSSRTIKEKDINSSKYDSTIETYDKILQYQKYKIHDRSHCPDISKYFGANTQNTVEIDTYITHPDNRENGIARILVFEGIKKSLNRLLKNENNKEIFLVSTLHEDNLSSKYVSEFFGLKDYLFVNRRNGRDRQVHIFGMKREEVPEYINKMEKKVAVLYNYNPNNIQITETERAEIIQEQMNYELNELQRLKGIKSPDSKKYTGYIRGKETKIEILRNLSAKLEVCQKKKVNLKKNSNPAGTGAGGDVNLDR